MNDARISMPNALRFLIAALAVAATGSCAESTAPSEAEDLEQPGRDVLMAQALVALAKEGPIHITFVTDDDIIVRSVDSGDKPEALAMCEEPQPVCSVSQDAGIFAMRGFLRCVRDARANNVCGDGGDDFHLEFDDDAGDNGEVHLHCRGECDRG